MIELFATATYDPDDREPICLVVYAQGDRREVISFAHLHGLDVLPIDWNGKTLAAKEVMLREVDHPEAEAQLLLSLLEAVAPVTWINDLAPDLPYGGTIPNVYPTRGMFWSALEQMPAFLEPLHDA